MSKNPKNWGKLMKIANIDREILHNFWTTWRISMKFSGKMCLMIILKVTKNQGFTPSLEEIFLEKLEGRSNWHPPAVLGLKHKNVCENVVEDLETRFNTSSYEVKRPLFINKNKKVAGLIKDHVVKK